tara:strand:- start:8694 stop:9644 length:951 start_codon:yes stop_codon:yes gene_type:complete
MNKSALIIGISGQDGAYLARFLLRKNYVVYGSSRDHKNNSFSNLKTLGIYNKVSLHTLDIKQFNSILNKLKELKPSEVYSLAGQSSVGLSFELPNETFESISIGTLNLLEASKMLPQPPKIYSAGSSECFGNTTQLGADEETPFDPKSPYAISKVASSMIVKTYRESYNLFCCTGFSFNHESPLRPNRFVTKKIIKGVLQIKSGKLSHLEMGDISISRDWGWAPEYVEAMWLMLQSDDPKDFIIGTGKSYSLEKFIEIAFLHKELAWKDYVVSNKNKYRPNEIQYNVANPKKIKGILNWEAKVTFEKLIEKLFQTK